jgi:class 3 adenylate cyclase
VPGALRPGHLSYLDRDQNVRRIAGYSPLKTKRWTLTILEPDTVFAAPLRALARQSTLTAAVIGAVVTALALLLARGIVQPMRSLAEAARALREGNFDAARIVVRRSDEIGDLEQAFDTMAKELKERARERDVFGRVVSPEVREKLLSGELGLGGETRFVAVLFSDIRGFSSMSESMDPQDVVTLLNEYLTHMTAAVRPWEGYVNNFIGDAIVVVFGAPVEDTEVEHRAAQAALAMREALGRLNKLRQARGEARLETGIGISAGEVVAGQIGSMERMLYTVIGDAVNVAARLESLTKEHPDHPILITSAVARGIEGREGVAVLSLGQVQVKGRVEPVDLFALHEAPGAS